MKSNIIGSGLQDFKTHFQPYLEMQKNWNIYNSDG